MAVFGPKTQNIKNPEMCVPAASQDTTQAKKSGENINFEKSYSKNSVSKMADFHSFWPDFGQNHRKRANFVDPYLGNGSVFFDSVKRKSNKQNEQKIKEKRKKLHNSLLILHK